jgi:hypothetical protein
MRSHDPSPGHYLLPSCCRQSHANLIFQAPTHFPNIELQSKLVKHQDLRRPRAMSPFSQTPHRRDAGRAGRSHMQFPSCRLCLFHLFRHLRLLFLNHRQVWTIAPPQLLLQILTPHVPPIPRHRLRRIRLHDISRHPQTPRLHRRLQHLPHRPRLHFLNPLRLPHALHRQILRRKWRTRQDTSENRLGGLVAFECC